MIKREELANPASCLNRANDDEMVFVLLERDIASTAAIMAWVRARIRHGKNKVTDPQIVDALDCMRRMALARVRTLKIDK